MKTRNGFVSNSSSSSFIIGLANVPEGTPGAQKINLNENNELNYKELYKLSKWSSRLIKLNEDDLYELSIISFNGSIVKTTFKNGDYLLILNNTGEEPEYDDNNGEYNYNDVDLSEDWFSLDDLVTAETIQKFGGEIDYGGGFNG